MNKSWTEGDKSGLSSSAGEVTWNVLPYGCEQPDCYNSTFVIASVPDWTSGGVRYVNITLNTTWYQRLLDEGSGWKWSEGLLMIGYEGGGENTAQYYSSDYYNTDSEKVPVLWVDYTLGIDTVTDPVWIHPSVDGQTNNTNITINISHSGTDVNISFYVNNESYFYNKSMTVIGSHWNWTTNFSDGTYVLKASVYNYSSNIWSNNITRTLKIDTTIPTITLNLNNSFNTSSVSRINQYDNYLYFDITVADESALFGFMVNATEVKTGTSYFNYTNISFGYGNKTFNFTRNVSTSSWPAGVYNITIIASDSHTINSIDKYDVNDGINTIRFDTVEGNRIEISSDGSSYSTLHTKKTDRYWFGWNYLFADSTRKFTLKSNNKIYYLSGSKYTAHFVVLSNRLNGNWIDFENIGKDYSVKKISDKEYDIIFTNLPLTNQIISKSIGGTNKITESYFWYKGNSSISSNSSSAYGKTENFLLNISRNLSYAIPTSNFVFNGTIYDDVTNTTYTNYIIFSKDITIPRPVGISQNLPYFWNVTIIQPINNDKYTFEISDTINVSTSLLHNCTEYDISTLNVSFINFADDNPVDVNYEYSFDYSGNNFSDSGTGANFSLCLFEDETIVTGDFFIEWINNSFLYTYYIEDLTLTNTTQTLTLRVTAGTTDTTATVYNQDNELFEGVYIRYLKYDVDTNDYLLVGIGKTNFEGELVMPLVQNTERYQFMLYYPYSTLLQTTIPSYITGTSILFQLSAVEDVAGDFHKVMNIDYSLSFSNITDTFTWVYSDSNSVISRGCMDVYKIIASGFNNTISEECLSVVSGTITSTVTRENGTTYLANTYVTISGEDWFIDSLTYTYPSKDSNPAQFMGLLIAFIMTIAFAFAFKYSVELGVIAIPLPLLFCCLMGIVDIATPIAVGIEIAAIILAIILNKVVD